MRPKIWCDGESCKILGTKRHLYAVLALYQIHWTFYESGHPTAAVTAANEAKILLKQEGDNCRVLWVCLWLPYIAVHSCQTLPSPHFWQSLAIIWVYNIWACSVANRSYGKEPNTHQKNCGTAKVQRVRFGNQPNRLFVLMWGISCGGTEESDSWKRVIVLRGLRSSDLS
jgi:hypothetical protein